jgi:hypothetical protein
MKKLFSILLALCLTVSVLAFSPIVSSPTKKASAAAEIDVYFIAGQSNASGYTNYGSGTHSSGPTYVGMSDSNIKPEHTSGYPNILYYGNAMTELNQNPTTYEDYSAHIPGFSSARFTKVSNNDLDFNHHFGAVAFVGFEWFVAKKVSVGAEVNISAIASWGNLQYATLEGYNTLSEKVETWTELFKPSSFAFDFGTQNVGANLSVNFYF